MSAVYTFDVFSSLDGFASVSGGDSGGPSYMASRWASNSGPCLPQYGAADFDLELLETRRLDGRTQELVYRPTLH
jgi:hypothetical protein